MLANLYRRLVVRKRRRALSNIRREFKKCGYPLDRMGDAQVEAALTRGKSEIFNVVLNAKIMNHALRRLSKLESREPESFKKAA